MTTLVILPLVIPLATAIASLFFWQRRGPQRLLTVVGTALLAAAGLALLTAVQRYGIIVVQAGNWPAPFGITLVADLMSAIMVAIAGLMGAAVALYSLASMDEAREQHGYYPLFNILLVGVNGSFLTGDMFNLYVWFEVMLIASFVLISLGGERAQLEGAIKYVTLNLLSSAMFLSMLGVLYGLTGTLNMADLAVQLSESADPGLVRVVAIMSLVAFGIKAAIFPLFFWLPASYHTPPVAISAIFAGLLTKVGVYVLVRAFTLLFTEDTAFTQALLLFIAATTMVIGVFGATAQEEFRRILSFHIISQIGYMIMGLALYTPLAIAGTVFYIVHHIIVKTNLFLVSGLVNALQGSYQLKRLGGLYRAYPGLSLLFLIPALSLAGIPPLSGFWAKLTLIQAGIGAGQYVVVAVALFVGLLTLYSMMKIWTQAFWQERPGGEDPRPAAGSPVRAWTLYLVPIGLLAALTIVIGLRAEWLFDLSVRAADQLLDPAGYIEAVLGP